MFLEDNVNVCFSTTISDSLKTSIIMIRVHVRRTNLQEHLCKYWKNL